MFLWYILMDYIYVIPKPERLEPTSDFVEIRE